VKSYVKNIGMIPEICIETGISTSTNTASGIRKMFYNNFLGTCAMVKVANKRPIVKLNIYFIFVIFPVQE